MFRHANADYKPVSSDIESSRLSDPVRPRIIPEPSWYRKHLTGWRFGILNGAILASAVLLLNLIITIQASKRPQPATSAITSKNRRLLFEGDCKESGRLNVLAHLLINAMSTLLLSASNYGMQVLSAPTRSEIDASHAAKKWLDIGVLSVRNLKSISRKRAVLWATLGASSLPLHLLYVSNCNTDDFMAHTCLGTTLQYSRL